MNIVFLDAETLGDSNLDGIRKFGNLSIYKTTSKKEILPRCKDADIVLTNKVVLDKEILQSLPKLKLICITATGMNNVDLEFAKKAKIEVKNVAGYSTNAVAQHTLMFVLNFLGQLRYYDKYCKSGDWAKSATFCHLNKKREVFELEGKTWGIVGFGTIGKRVAALAEAFGAKVQYFSTSGKNSDKKFKQIKNLSDLLKQSDIVSIHAPLNNNTQNLIAKNELKMLKNNAILVNVGRGGIVNESDLASVIKERDFYFACDVLGVEPMSKKHPFLDKKLKGKILITPHTAWAYKEARERLLLGVENNIKEFLKNIKADSKSPKTTKNLVKKALKAESKKIESKKVESKKDIKQISKKPTSGKPAAKKTISKKPINSKPAAKTTAKPAAKTTKK